MQTTTLTAASLALALIALLAVACGKDKKTDTTTAASTAATATAKREPDPAVLAKQAADQVEALKSFHFLLEHESGSSPIALSLNMTRAEGDIVKPDRLRADVDAKATQLGGQNVKVKVISVSDKAVISNPFNPNQFVPLPGASRLADVFDPAAGTTAALRSVQNPKITGEETINGVKVWRLEGDVDAANLSAFASIAEPGYMVKGTAWIGQDTPYVYRIRMAGPLGSKDTPGVIRRIDLSKFDEPVTIEAPAG
jgi:hypothetical protein